MNTLEKKKTEKVQRNRQKSNQVKLQFLDKS